MQTIIQAFKNEIIESEKSRTDLLKWKFIAIAALGSIGLGLKPSSPQLDSPQQGVFLSFANTLIICLIPLVCVYIDLLCKNLNLRILVIGNYFLKCEKPPNDSSEYTKILKFYKEYEKFCDLLRAGDQVKPFAMEDWAQEISTIICSILIIIIAFFSDPSHVENNLIFLLLILTTWVVSISTLIYYLRPEAQENSKVLGYLAFLVFLLAPLLPTLLQDWMTINPSLILSNNALSIAFFGILGVLISVLINKKYYQKKKQIKEIKEVLPDRINIVKKKRIIINNEKLLELLKFSYTLQDIRNISRYLETQGTFNFPQLHNNLFSAAILAKKTKYTGYDSVWVRDNIYVAYSHYFVGETEVSTKNVRTLMDYFRKSEQRFKEIIKDKDKSQEIMKRPHIRFNGHNLEEIEKEWNHAQNDALGYFLWFYCKLARERLLKPQPQQQDLEILALFPFYFQAIQYWEDEDSGHWEEDRKIEASSIGVVIAGLKELKLLLSDTCLASDCKYEDKLVTAKLLDELINKGKESLKDILPHECIKPDSKKREYDAALLFLIYPLEVIEGEIAEQILENVIQNLQGDYGIRRYLGDSFWCRNYKDIPKKIRTTISNERKEWLKKKGRELKIGEEAQWCIFDPIVSAIFGLKFQKTKKTEDLKQQTHYLNRALGQLTGSDHESGECKCPELYYLQNSQYVPGDATPLLWTQANLRIALRMMEQSLS